MERCKRFVKQAMLLSGFGAVLAACTRTAPPYPEYGGYYGYPPSYYYPPPEAYGAFGYGFGSPFFGFDHRDRFRHFSQPPQAAPPPQASPSPSPGGAQSGSSAGAPRGFLGNVLRKRQEQSQ